MGDAEDLSLPLYTGAAPNILLPSSRIPHSNTSCASAAGAAGPARGAVTTAAMGLPSNVSLNSR